MDRGNHDAENSPYTVETKNRYDLLEDDVGDGSMEDIDKANVSDDSIELTKRLGKLKSKSKKRTKKHQSKEQRRQEVNQRGGNVKEREEDKGRRQAEGNYGELVREEKSRERRKYGEMW